MKRFVFRASMIALVLVLALSVAVSAAPFQAATTKTLSTNYTLVNMGTQTASVVVQYLKEDGTAWAASADSTTFDIPGNFGQKIVAQYFDSTMTPGKGSAVVQSNQPLGAVVQILARNQTPTSGAYSGFTSGSSKLVVPLVLKNRSTASGLTNSQIIIQNVEQTAITVSIDFVPQSGYTAYTKSGITIQPGSSYYWDATDEAGLANGWGGSAIINVADTKKAVAVSNLFSGANSVQTFSAFPQEAATTGWVIPLFTSRLTNGLSTPVAIQNVSGVEIAAGGITMECTSTISTPATINLTSTAALPDGAAYYFNPVSDTTIPANWSGACRLTASQNVVVFVQMRRPGVSDETGAYEAFPASSTNTKVVIPLMSKRQANGFATVATIQNLDTVNAANVKLTYTPSPSYTGSSTPIVLHKTIPAGGNLIQNLRFNDVPEIPNGWFGTLVVEADDAQPARPLVGFVQLTNYLGAAGDTFMAHDAFTLP
ncbi:hypothetical protein [Anaerolinea sp.]|uniref:hypothetical protein n=1 Tax=Anaerolinea sp. TaxID=1872519 RepID=UPI002ACE33B8|nr:hypothetical protein [Anaerolinea sp.]